MRDHAIRFAVGSDDGPQSSIWRLWTRAKWNDVYFSGRNLGGVFKVSLHGAKADKPALWRIAFVRSDSPFLKPGQDRAVQEWSPPAELTPGWTRALNLGIPASEVVMPRYRSALTDKVTWFPVPPAGWAVNFDVFFASPAVLGPDEWPGRDSMGTRPVFRAPLADGRTVWLLAHAAKVDEGVREGIEKVRRMIEAAPERTDRSDPPPVDTRGFFIGVLDEDGTRYFMDLAV